jgi:hypothetical protein
MDGLEVNTTFQQHKRAKKVGKEDLYTCHETHRGSKGVDITSIKTISVRMGVGFLPVA